MSEYKDYVVRGTAANGSIRVFAATTRNTVEEARRIHNTSPTATATLGRLLTAGAMMGTAMKGERDLLTLQMKGDGPLGGMLVTADSQGHVKGYAVEPQADLPPVSPGKLNVGGLVGKGSLTVIQDVGLREPYVGRTELVSGEIADDLTYYYAQSEQVPSAVGLGVLVDTDCTVKQAGGFLLQLMPGADDDILAALEVTLNDLPHVTALLEEGATPEDILYRIVGDYGLTITEKKEVCYHCDCSRERVERALVSIGEKDLTQLIEEDKGAELHCHFCNKAYRFTEEELVRLLTEAQATRKPDKPETQELAEEIREADEAKEADAVRAEEEAADAAEEAEVEAEQAEQREKKQ